MATVSDKIEQLVALEQAFLNRIRTEKEMEAIKEEGKKE